MPSRPLHAAATSARAHLRQSGAFLVVGGLAFCVDTALYNLLVFAPDGDGPLHHKPLTAKVIAIAVASVITYLGNHLWTFRHRDTPATTGRVGRFIAVNLVATGFQLAPLAFSRYVLDWTGPVADNVFGTGIGLVLATALRYIGYDRYVFTERAGP